MFGISVFILGLLTSAPHLGRSAYRFAGITLAIVMLVPSTDSPRRIALHRFVEVGIGTGAALVLTVFWPEREEPHINTRDLKLEDIRKVDSRPDRIKCITHKRQKL
jgi:uncharacterized membrane protein YccC